MVQWSLLASEHHHYSVGVGAVVDPVRVSGPTVALTSFSLVWDLATLPCGDLPILGQTWRIEDFDHSSNLRSVTIHFLMCPSLPDAIGQAAVAQCLKVISEEPIFEELGGHVRASLERFRKACQVLTGPTGMMGRHSEERRGRIMPAGARSGHSCIDVAQKSRPGRAASIARGDPAPAALDANSDSGGLTSCNPG
jgi:hypothetical protein